METRKRSLLEKYDIPISHLDFDYIKNCTDAKELERIVKILRSGEEGYFAELTKFAEDKLKEIKPNSKILRSEEILTTRAHISASEWKEFNQPFIEWSNDIKNKDKLLFTLADLNDKNDSKIPAIRKQITKNIFRKIDQWHDKNKTKNLQKSGTEFSRIKSTDYKQWDKYDPDTEILKMELEEEKVREEVERKNRINRRKSEEFAKNNLNTFVVPIVDKEITEKLTDIEKENLSMRCKEKGNEYFRAKEYEYAVKEYTQCLNILPTAAGYNNRAIAYLKLLQYQKCIDDCDKCLEIEPKNLKALLRKGQALLGLGKKHEALKVYIQMISIEPGNKTAINNLNNLRNQICSPPTDATRIKIQDNPGIGNNSKTPTTNTIKSNCSLNIANCENINKKKEDENSYEKLPNKKPDQQPEIIEHKEDISKLIIPNKIVKSKLASAVQTLEQFKKQNKQNALKQKMQPKKENNSEKMEIKIFGNEEQRSSNANFIKEIRN